MGFPLFADAFKGQLFKFYEIVKAVEEAKRRAVSGTVFIVINSFGMTIEMQRPLKGLNFYKVFSDKVLKYTFNPKLKDYKIDAYKQ
jgi:hypothetical protein